jgi:hypothetical protein
VLSTDEITGADLFDDGDAVMWAKGGYPGSGQILRMVKSTRAITTLADRESYPEGIAANASAYYWVNYDNALAQGPWGAVRRLPRGGGNVSSVVSSVFFGEGVLADEGQIFWTEQRGLMTDIPFGVLGSEAHFHFATDGTNLFYFTQDSLWRVRKSGGTPLRLAEAADTRDVASSASWIVWAEEASGRIRRACASTPEPVQDIAVSQSRPWALASREGWVYWAERGGAVKRAPLAGGAATVLATGRTNTISLVVDTQHVYLVDFDTGRLTRMLR